MNVTSQQTTTSAAKVEPPRSKFSKRATLIRKLNSAGDPATAWSQQLGVQGVKSSPSGLGDGQTQDGKTAQGGRILAGLGDKQRQKVRSAAGGVDGNRGNYALKVLKALPVDPPQGTAELYDASDLKKLGVPPPSSKFLVMVHNSSNQVVASPDVTTVHLDSGSKPMSHENEFIVHADGTMTIAGSELLAQVAIPPKIGAIDTLVPQGGVMAYTLANPRFIDGCRLGNLLENYDQFAWEDVTFEYVQGTNLTQSGQLIMAFINDPNDGIVHETGFTALRDLFSRSGAILFSVRENARCKLGHPLLKWYYTGRQLDASLELPGAILVLNVLDQTNSTSSVVPLGMLAMHYRVRVRAPALDSIIAPLFSKSSDTLNMTNASITAGGQVYVTVANSGLAAAQTSTLAVYYAIVAAVDDTGPGSATWRTWLDPQMGSTLVFSAGMLLVWRVSVGGQIWFFPDVASAVDAVLQPNFAARVWLGSATVAPGTTKGFKLWSITGANLQGDQ